MERAWDISCDANSNIYIVGDYADSLCVNGVTYPGLGLSDSYVLKYNSSGQLLWAKTFGSTNEDVALGVGCDAAGNCYVGGYYIDTFNCQGQSVQSYGMWDAYLLKLDPQGSLLWLRSFGGPMNDIGHGLAVNDAGNVYVAGWFADTIKFSGGDTIVSAGGSDIYCSAWDTEGNFLWARRAGMSGVEYGYKVACDNNGAAYVTGVAGSGSQFGAFTLDSDGVFVVKYNALGQEEWLASTHTPFVISISVQPNQNGQQFGMISGRVIGSGSIGQFNYTSIAESEDAYWAQFDALSGTWTFLGVYGGALSDKGRDCDYEDYPVFVSSFEGNANFGGNLFASSGESDLMLGFNNPVAPQWIATGGLTRLYHFKYVRACSAIT